MFTKPIIGITMFQHAATMSIDMLAVVIGPEFARIYALAFTGCVLIVALNLLAQYQLVT